MDPVDSLIKVKRVPSELIWNLMDTLAGLVFGVGVECCMFPGLELGMG